MLLVSFIKKDDILNLIEETDPAETEALTPVSGDDLFYMIFTSGSTGNPKGVQITSDCLNHYLDWSVGLGNTRDEKEGRIFLNQAPFSFDLSVMDLYTCLACGGTLFPLTKTEQAELQSASPRRWQTPAHLVWVSTPSFADMCLRDPNLTAICFRSSVCFYSAGRR